MSFNKEQLEWVDEYYVAAITDFCDGIKIDELKEILKLYEEDENYEACAGISKAIEGLEDVLITYKGK